MAPFWLDHKEMTWRVMGESPADRLAILFRDQEDAVVLGTAMLQLAPMLHREAGIATAIGLEGNFIVLQAGDEGQDRRFVGGQTCLADTNGPEP
jgi:hypothetical protein